MVTLESLIEEGTNIREGIKYIPTAPGVTRLYKAFSLSDTKIYGTWKSMVIRYLDKKIVVSVILKMPLQSLKSTIVIPLYLM